MHKFVFFVSLALAPLVDSRLLFRFVKFLCFSFALKKTTFVTRSVIAHCGDFRSFMRKGARNDVLCAYLDFEYMTYTKLLLNTSLANALAVIEGVTFTSYYVSSADFSTMIP